ncbi:glycosyltransferase [Psychrobacillus lasiicapitis]|uniref:Glycosyltransferase family 4 protein n=1 Tax=Psychrobacillus lasiicapitis TaxID=1636719 RepID=A0A544TE07_9BACI|nr:glycosyltransferase [Psychrobacillus lasiicapitis]TQR15697.1 glycosyltransferase family 4 protein [Psychrobacillus lasiicapitis]GGA18702.1 capsular polysaccharide biosynthesis protein [Psychrobacillus lasiicapitis]
MKVALLAPSRSIHTQKWALFYQSQGIEVKVYTFKDHYSEDNAKLVPTEILPKLLPSKASYLAAAPGLKKMLKEWNPDVLHAHYVSSYGLLGAMVNYKKYFVSVWGKDIFVVPKKSKLNQKLIEFTLDKATAIFSTSYVMAKETNLYTNKKVEVTPFGVDIEQFYPAPEGQETDDKIIIGTVKALEDKYGIADLVKGFALFHKEFPNSELLITGDGPQRAEYEQLAKDLGIADVTTFTGKVPNTEVPAIIRKMSIFAVPSTEDSESFGVAAVEGMACGVPVVVSNVGGLPEVVVQDVTGIVVDKNSPDQLATAFKKLARNSDLRAVMGKAGVAHVKEHYSWVDNAHYMLSLYEKY